MRRISILPRILAALLSLALALPGPVFALRNETTEGAGLEELTKTLPAPSPLDHPGFPAGLEETYRVNRGMPLSANRLSTRRDSHYQSVIYKGTSFQVFVVEQLKSSGWSDEQRRLPEPQYALVKLVEGNKISVIERKGNVPDEIILKPGDWPEGKKVVYLHPSSVVISRTSRGDLRIRWNVTPGYRPSGDFQVLQAAPAAGAEEWPGWVSPSEAEMIFGAFSLIVWPTSLSGQAPTPNLMAAKLLAQNFLTKTDSKILIDSFREVSRNSHQPGRAKAPFSLEKMDFLLDHLPYILTGDTKAVLEGPRFAMRLGFFSAVVMPTVTTLQQEAALRVEPQDREAVVSSLIVRMNMNPPAKIYREVYPPEQERDLVRRTLEVLLKPEPSPSAAGAEEPGDLEALSRGLLEKARLARAVHDSHPPYTILAEPDHPFNRSIEQEGLYLSQAYRLQLRLLGELGLLQRVVYPAMGVDLFLLDAAAQVLAIDSLTTRQRIEEAYGEFSRRYGPFRHEAQQLLNRIQLVEADLGDDSTRPNLESFVRRGHADGPVTVFLKGFGWLVQPERQFFDQIDPLLWGGDVVVLFDEPGIEKALRQRGYVDYLTLQNVTEPVLRNLELAGRQLRTDPEHGGSTFFHSGHFGGSLNLHLAEPFVVLKKVAVPPAAGAEEKRVTLAGELESLITRVGSLLSDEIARGNGRLGRTISEIKAGPSFVSHRVAYLPTGNLKRLVVIGDLHGDEASLVQVLRKIGWDQETNTLPEGIAVVSAGDRANLGHSSIEVEHILYSLKLKYPDRVVLLVGNHDVDQATDQSPLVKKLPHAGWYFHELNEALTPPRGQKVYEQSIQLASQLPVALVTESGFIVVHGNAPSSQPSKGSAPFDTTQGLLAIRDPGIQDQLIKNLVPVEGDRLADVQVDELRPDIRVGINDDPAFFVGRRSRESFLAAVGAAFLVGGHQHRVPVRAGNSDRYIGVITAGKGSPQRPELLQDVEPRYLEISLTIPADKIDLPSIVRPVWAAGAEEKRVPITDPASLRFPDVLREKRTGDRYEVITVGTKDAQLQRTTELPDPRYVGDLVSKSFDALKKGFQKVLTSGMEEQELYKNSRASYEEVIRTLKEFGQKAPIDSLFFYEDPDQAQPRSQYFRNKGNPPPGYDFSDFFIQASDQSFGDEASQRIYRLHIVTNSSGRPGYTTAEVMAQPIPGFPTPPAAGMEEPASVLTRVPMGDFAQDLDDWLKKHWEAERQTEHYGEAQILLRVVEHGDGYGLVGAIAAQKWVARYPELGEALEGNLSWEVDGESPGPGLVQIALNRYRFENSREAVVIERVHILPGTLRLEYRDELEIRSDILELIGEWGRSRGTPVYLIRPEAIRENMEQIGQPLKESTISHHYDKPVDRGIWYSGEDTRLVLRGSSLTSEKELRWFLYHGHERVRPAAGAEEEPVNLGHLDLSTLKVRMYQSDSGAKIPVVPLPPQGLDIPKEAFGEAGYMILVLPGVTMSGGFLGSIHWFGNGEFRLGEQGTGKTVPFKESFTLGRYSPTLEGASGYLGLKEGKDSTMVSGTPQPKPSRYQGISKIHVQGGFDPASGLRIKEAARVTNKGLIFLELRGLRELQERLSLSPPATGPPSSPATGAEEPPLLTQDAQDRVYVGNGRWFRSNKFFIPDPSAKAFLQTLRGKVPLNRQMEVLNVGVGPWSIALGIADRVGRLVAVDKDPVLARWARENASDSGLSNVEVLQPGAGEFLPPAAAGRKYDLIIAEPPLMPFSDQMRALVRSLHSEYGESFISMNDGGPDGRREVDRLLENARSLLKPGGSLLLLHPQFLGLRKTQDKLESVGLQSKILHQEDIRVATPQPPRISFLPNFRDYIGRANGVRLREKSGDIIYRLAILQITPAAGAEEQTWVKPTVNIMELYERWRTGAGAVVPTPATDELRLAVQSQDQKRAEDQLRLLQEQLLTLPLGTDTPGLLRPFQDSLKSINTRLLLLLADHFPPQKPATPTEVLEALRDPSSAAKAKVLQQILGQATAPLQKALPKNAGSLLLEGSIARRTRWIPAAIGRVSREMESGSTVQAVHQWLRELFERAGDRGVDLWKQPITALALRTWLTTELAYFQVAEGLSPAYKKLLMDAGKASKDLPSVIGTAGLRLKSLTGEHLPARLKEYDALIADGFIPQEEINRLLQTGLEEGAINSHRLSTISAAGAEETEVLDTLSRWAERAKESNRVVLLSEKMTAAHLDQFLALGALLKRHDDGSVHSRLFRSFYFVTQNPELQTLFPGSTFEKVENAVFNLNKEKRAVSYIARVSEREFPGAVSQERSARSINTRDERIYSLGVVLGHLAMAAWDVTDPPWEDVRILAEKIASLTPPVQSAGAEEPNPPKRPEDFGTGEFPAMSIGGSLPYTVKLGDQIFPTGVTYQTMHDLPLDPMQTQQGIPIKLRKIQTITVPLDTLGRFAVGPLTFRILPMGGDQGIRPLEESSSGGVAVAPMAKRYLLQVWLDKEWADLDMVHLEDGVPVVIGREDLPATLDGLTQFDLEGKLGRPVDDRHYREVFDGWHTKGKSEPEWRVAVSWRENELDKIAYLPRQALAHSISRGDARVEKRPGWSVSNAKFVPAYRQTGHLQIEIMGDEVVFSDLGSSNPTQIEVRRDWAEARGHRYRVHDRQVSLAGDLREDTEAVFEESRTNAGAGKPGGDPAEAEQVVSELVDRLRDQLIVIEHLRDGSEVPLNPQKLARFPFERPFQISIRIDGKQEVTNEFKVEEGQLHVRRPGEKSWEPAGTSYRAEEWIPVAGQSHLDVDASRVQEGYRVLYAPVTNTVVVLNYSPYQLQIALLSAAGAEERNLNRVLPQVADSVQGSGVVVLGPEAIESRTGLEELVRRAPPALLKRMVFYAVGNAWATRLRELNSAVQVIPDDDVGKLAALLVSLPEADRVTVLGPLLLVRQLQRLLPAAMAVTRLDPTIAFRLILAALGIPDSVLNQVDAAGLEESLARARAA